MQEVKTRIDFVGSTELLELAEEYIVAFFNEKMPKQYVYHDLMHTQDVVRVSQQIGLAYGLPLEDLQDLLLAAWFHDTGYDRGPEQHEDRSTEYVHKFLDAYDYPIGRIEKIKECIMATKMPQKPNGLLQQIICDADLSHLGEKSYWLRTAKVRQEIATIQQRNMSEDEWLDFEIAFMLGHTYHTDVAKQLFEPRKFKHVSQLRKQKIRLDPTQISVDDILEIEEKHIEKEKNTVKQNSKEAIKQFGRGVETMYRTTYNTHNNLSALADQKANLMLSVNTVMISITLSMLVPQLQTQPQLVIPTVVLLTVCLTAIVFATLSTRPKVSTGSVTLDDIRNKRSNLLFFGNFYDMKLEDFQWGMMEMIRDPDFQYSSMTRDLYFLGKVLNQKYRYLTICYNIFMYGIIITVILFAAAFVFGSMEARPMPH